MSFQSSFESPSSLLNEPTGARGHLQIIFEKDSQDRMALLERYQGDPQAQSLMRHALPGMEFGSRAAGQRLLRRNASEGPVKPDVIERALSGGAGEHRASSPTDFHLHGYLEQVVEMEPSKESELRQILDVIEGDEVSLDDLYSAFVVYKVSEDPEDVELVLRDHTDGSHVARQRIGEIYREVKKLASAPVVGDVSGSAPVIGENVLVSMQGAHGRDLIPAKVLDAIASEGKRTKYLVQMPDGKEFPLNRTNLYTMKEASIPHSHIPKPDVLPETKELDLPSAESLHAKGIEPDDYTKHIEFAVKHAFRKSVFCTDWAHCTVRTEMLPMTNEDIEAFISQDWDHLQESVAPKIASVLSLYTTKNFGGGSEVSGGSTRKSDEDGMSGVSGLHVGGSEVGSGSRAGGSRASGGTHSKTASISRSKSNGSDAGTDRSRSPRGSEASGSHVSGSAAGSRRSRDKSERGGGSRFRRQHGLFVDLDTCSTVDKPLHCPLTALEDALQEAGEKTRIIVARFENAHGHHSLNKEEALKVGALLGTRVDQRLIEIYQDQEIKLQNRLKESKKEAGRLIIRDNGLEIDTDAQIEKVEENWQETKSKIDEEIKLIDFEIAKIEDNIYGDTPKVCAEKTQIQKGKLRLAQARLEHEKAATKAKKESIKSKDPDLEASHFAVTKELEQIERILWLLEAGLRSLKIEEVERRNNEIRAHEIERAQQDRDAIIWAEPVEPSPQEYFEMACRLQRAVRSHYARRTFSGIVSFWGKCTGSISFQGAMPPLDKNFVMSDGPEIWNYYRDYGLCIMDSNGVEHTKVVKRYTQSRQVQIASVFDFELREGMEYSIRFPEDPMTVKALLRDVFLREDIHSAGFLGRQQLNRALNSMGVFWDQEDLDELVTRYSRVAPQKLNIEEYLLSLDDEKLRGSISVDLLRAKITTLPGNQPASRASGDTSAKGPGRGNLRRTKTMNKGAPSSVASGGASSGVSSALKTFQRAGSSITAIHRVSSAASKASGVSGNGAAPAPGIIGGSHFGNESQDQKEAVKLAKDIEGYFEEPVDTAAHISHEKEEAKAERLADIDAEDTLDENQFLDNVLDVENAEVHHLAAKWALFGSMSDCRGTAQRIDPSTACHEGVFLVKNDVKDKIAVVDSIVDENGKIDADDGSFYEQALTVQRAGALACIIVNMEGVRKVRERTLAFEEFGEEAKPSEGLRKIFSMHQQEEADATEELTIPVLMVAYVDKRHLTDHSRITLKLVDEQKSIPFQTWPYRSLSLKTVPDDVNLDRVCCTNLVRQVLHKIQHDLIAMGSTMFDPGVWTKDELLEALANNSWRGREHKEYSLRELVTTAKSMECQHPSTTSVRFIDVTLERGRALPKDAVSGASPDTYVHVRLEEGIEAKSKVHMSACDPIYNQRLRLFVPDSQMRKDELALHRRKFDIICQANAERIKEQEQASEADILQGHADADFLHHLMPADLPLMFSDQGGGDFFGGEDGITLIMEEYDANQNGYLEWEEFVNLYDDLIPRPSNLELHVMRKKTDGEADIILGSVYISLDGVEQGQLRVETLLDENNVQILGSGDKLASLSLRVTTYSISSETGVSQDPATDALSLLAYSSRARADLECSRNLKVEEYPFSIVVRQYEPKMAEFPERHFRVFVYDNQITGIAQRHHEIYFYRLHVDSLSRTCKEAIINFFWTSVNIRMQDEAYTKYIFDVFVHDSAAGRATLQMTLLGFSPFDQTVDACLYNWNAPKDFGILTMGRVFAPSGDPDLQPTITLPNGRIVPNVDMRVRDNPLPDPIYALPSVWKKKVTKLMDKLEAEYQGRHHREDITVERVDEAVSFSSCNPSEFVKFLSPAKAARSAARSLRLPGSKYLRSNLPNTRLSTPDSFFSTGWGAANMARLGTPIAIREEGPPGGSVSHNMMLSRGETKSEEDGTKMRASRTCLIS